MEFSAIVLIRKMSALPRPMDNENFLANCRTAKDGFLFSVERKTSWKEKLLKGDGICEKFEEINLKMLISQHFLMETKKK